VITFKDSGGNFLNKTLTLTCAGTDTFEDGTTSKVFAETYGSIQIVASGSKWYIISGTQANTMTVSTMNATAISSLNISSGRLTASTVNFYNNAGSTLSMFQQSTFLYFNNFIVAGARVGVGQMFFPSLPLAVSVTIGNATLGTDYTITSNTGRTYYNFLATGKTMTFTVANGPATTTYIAVGGGGGGGWAEGGGGGAGGVVTSASYSLASGTYNIVIGTGGIGGSNTGGASATNGSTGVSTTFGSNITALGGSGGVSSYNTGGTTGGSGGGASVSNPSVVNLGTSGQGYNGGTAYVNGGLYGAGGGGGASALGGNGSASGAGNGGAGVTWNNGTALLLAGGGGGGSDGGLAAGTATYGGGSGANGTTGTGSPGSANTGGGGGGGGNGGANRNGGVGGSGFFSISFLATQVPIAFTVKSGLQLWLDAADVNGTGTNPANGVITTWVDKSGSGNNATQSGGTNALASSPPRITFNATSVFTCPLTAVPSAETVFIVSSSSSASAVQQAQLGSSASGGHCVYRTTNTTTYLTTYGIANCSAVSSAPVSQIFLVYYTYNSTTNQIFVNSNAGSVDSTTTSGHAFSGSGTTLIGGMTSGGSPQNAWIGSIYEILSYNRVLSGAEITQVYTYLNSKWNFGAAA
jgi:hypothetical protein